MTLSSSSKSDSNSQSQFQILKYFFWISVLSLIPFLIFFFVVVPCSDDIFYHNYAKGKTIGEFMVHHYSTWTGRYFSNFMMAANPYTLTSNEGIYPAMMLSVFSVFVLGLYYLLKSLLPFFSNEAKSQSLRHFLPLALTVGTLALFFHKMPRTADSLYWFAGASSHLLPMGLLFCAVGIYFRNLVGVVGRADPEVKPSLFKIVFSIFIISTISFIISGSNETLAIQWVFSLVFVIFYKKVILGRWDWTVFAPLTIALIGFAFLYFAPGNAVRAKELKGGHDVLLLLIKPWGLILETTVRYLSFSLIVALIAFFPSLKKINLNLSSSVKQPRSLMLLALFGLGFFALTFVPSVWTMGGLPPRRVLNDTYLFLLIYGFVLVAISAHTLSRLDRWSKRFHQRYSVKALTSVFAISLLLFFNNFYAGKDLIYLPQFFESITERRALITAGKETNLSIDPLKHFPTTFFYEDITVKTDDYKNIVFAEFYKLKSVRLSKDYEE